MLINIIHPETFKIKESTLLIGPCKEFKERDEKVEKFIAESLKEKNKVIWYKSEGSLKASMSAAALYFDPTYDFLFDERVSIIRTLPNGLTIPNVAQDKVTPEQWKELMNVYSSEDELREKVGNQNPVIFIGGMLECCVANAALYFDKVLRVQQEILYIPELCVTIDEKLLEKRMSEFKKKNIHSISYEYAMDKLTT